MSSPPVRRADKLCLTPGSTSCCPLATAATCYHQSGWLPVMFARCLYVWLDGQVWMHNTSAQGHLQSMFATIAGVCFELSAPGKVFAYGRYEWTRHRVPEHRRLRPFGDHWTTVRGNLCSFDALMAKYTAMIQRAQRASIRAWTSHGVRPHRPSASHGKEQRLPATEGNGQRVTTRISRGLTPDLSRSHVTRNPSSSDVHKRASPTCGRRSCQNVTPHKYSPVVQEVAPCPHCYGSREQRRRFLRSTGGSTYSHVSWVSIARRWFEQYAPVWHRRSRLMHDAARRVREDAPFGYLNAFKAHVNVGLLPRRGADRTRALAGGDWQGHAPRESRGPASWLTPCPWRPGPRCVSGHRNRLKRGQSSQVLQIQPA